MNRLRSELAGLLARVGGFVVSMLELRILGATVVMPILAAIYLERPRDRCIAVGFPVLLGLAVYLDADLFRPGGGLRLALWVASIVVPLFLALKHALRTSDIREHAIVVAVCTSVVSAVIATPWSMFVAWASLSHNPQSVYCDPGPPAEAHNFFFSGSGDCRIILGTWVPFVAANFAIVFLGLSAVISSFVLATAILSQYRARRPGTASMSADSSGDGVGGPTS